MDGVTGGKGRGRGEGKGGGWVEGLQQFSFLVMRACITLPLHLASPKVTCSFLPTNRSEGQGGADARAGQAG